MANVPKLLAPANTDTNIAKQIDEHFGGVEGSTLTKNFKFRKKLLILDFRDAKSGPPNPPGRKS